MSPVQKINVAIPRPLYQLLSYFNQDDDLTIHVGCRVLVSLGNIEITGIVLSTEEIDEGENHQLKPIINVLDTVPLFETQQLAFFQWCAQYYHAPIGEIIFTALPVALRKTRQVPTQKVWQLTEEGRGISSETLARAKKQQALFGLFETSPVLTESALEQLFPKNWRNTIKELEKKGLIERGRLPPFQPVQQGKNAPQTFDRSIKLTDDQQECIEQFQAWSDVDQPKPILLHGITGSGKTEIYLRLLEPYIARQQQALILIPEIGLTQQLITRFRQHFPAQQTVVLNSSLAKGERLENWVATKSGDADIIIGTRSAIFSPVKRLGIIIIDEEHDASFKQQDGFRYHARDLAVKRAYDHKIPVIMGTATPSLETLHNAQCGKYHYFSLKKRPGTRKPPTIFLQDTRSTHLEAGLSINLLNKLKETVEQGQQSMLFLNRRGFAPALFCSQCGWSAQCSDCNVNMTYHAGIQKVICHHCDNSYTVSQHCPECHSDSLSTQGQGTERLEFTLRNHFPDTPIIRIDRDTTARKGEMDKKLDIVRQGEPAILVGTQMLAKGHDFPNITFVGILDLDQSLFSIDYRAPERLAQLITQVAGRAGRGKMPGNVMLQTCQPEHPYLTTLLTSGYTAFANQLLEERKRWRFPPYSYQALLRAESLEMRHALQFLEASRQQLQPFNLSILGPIPAPMERKAKWYRAQLLLTTEQRKDIHYAISETIYHLNKLSKKGKLRWSIDIDPIDMA
jgi:primosomal protein N' (replication factor Y)